MDIQADDRLVFRANKTNTDADTKSKYKLALCDGYNYKLPVSIKDGEPVFTHYWNKKTGKESKSIGKKEYDKLDVWSQAKWHKCTEKKLSLPNKTYFRTKGNQVYIELTGLSKTEYNIMTSRYYKAVDTLIEMTELGIFKYERRTPELIEKNRREAMRKLLLKHFHLCEYEYNIILTKENSKRLLTELNKNDNIKDVEIENNDPDINIYPTNNGIEVWENKKTGFKTYYIKGRINSDGKKETVKTGVKVYPMSYHYPDNPEMVGVYKLEITLRKNVLKNVRIQNITKQDIAIEYLKAEFMKEVLNLPFTDKTKRELSTVIMQNDNILARVLRNEKKLAIHDSELAIHDSEIKDLKKAIRQIQKEYKKARVSQ